MLYGTSLSLGVFSFFATWKIIGIGKVLLLKADLFGKDLNKAGAREDKPKVPEGLGIVPAIIFLMMAIQLQVFLSLPDHKLVEYNAGLLSICMSILLGFADDFVDLAWRYKLIVPTIATFPLLVAYKGLTSVVMPLQVRPYLGDTLDLGLIYKIYMGSLSVFCTNSINIYAGINGIEVGQSFIIGCFVMIHNIIEIWRAESELIVS